jgi:hypothetical protein
MGLIKYDSTNTRSGSRAAKPTISFAKAGMITISGAAVAILKLKEGDKVSIFQDEEEPKDWYIAPDPAGFEIRPIKSGKAWAFNNAAIAGAVRLALKAEGSVVFPIAAEPALESEGLQCYAILTAVMK